MTERKPHSDLTPGKVFEFDGFRLDAENRLLSRSGERLALPARAFDTLLILVQRPAQLVTKNELLNLVWAGSFVEESNLTVAISTLRRVLGEDPQDRKFIQTVSGRGYRFISEVQTFASPSLLPEQVVADCALPVPGSAPSSHVTPEEIPLVPVPALLSHEAQPLTWPKPGIPSRWALLAGIFAVGLLVFWLNSLRVHRAKAAGLKVSALAVLPMSGTGMSEEELMGMTDAMIGYLGKLVAVRPMSSVLKYSVAPVDVEVAGREQSADAIVTAHLMRLGNVATLEVRLLRTSDGSTVWSRSYHGGKDGLATMQSAADHDLADELRKVIAAPPAAVPLAPIASVKPEAYQLYLRGRYFWNRRTEDGLRRSIDAFRRSIQADPNYAPAFAGLADAYALLASFSVESGRTATPDARAAALSAIQLDPTLAEPHASLGMIYFFTDWNGLAAEGEFERAIALNPNYATAHHWYALDLAAMGRFPQALYEIRRAQELDPLSLIISTNVGWIEYLNHSNGQAIAEYRKVLELDPSFVRARTRLGIAEMQCGDFAAAVADLQQAERDSGDPYVSGLLAEAMARNGQKQAAEKTLRDLEARSATKYVPPFTFALIELGFNDHRAAIKALEQAAEDRSTSMVYAKIDPSLDALRGDPEFEAILRRMRF